jgi:phosphatidate cytidylyltransferase
VNALVSRVLIAVPLLIVAVYAVYVGGWVMTAVAVVTAVIAVHELYVMTREFRPLIPAGMVGVILIPIAIHRGGLEWATAPLFLVLLLAFWLSAVGDVRQRAVVQLAVTLLGVVWIGLGLGLLVAIRDIPGPGQWGRVLLLAVFLGVWLSDTAAYLFGRMFGRRRLAGQISPNKTVEGLVAGLVCGFLAVFFTVYKQPSGMPLSPIHAIEFALAITFAGPIGDLFESYLKRDMGVKDTGRILGGHGGVLDRIDALLFAGAAAYFVALAIGRV